MKHKSDGITHSQPQIYKCKVCEQRLTSEQYHDTDCPDKIVTEE